MTKRLTNAAPVALRLPDILLGFAAVQAALVQGAKHISSVHNSSARQHGTLLVLPAEAFSLSAEKIPPSKFPAARCLAGLMDGAEPIGEVLTIWTLCDDAFMVPAKGGTGEGEMVAAIVCAFHHGSWGWRSWHWGRVVLVKWELRLVTALCPTLICHRKRVKGAF
jgi:hypothetical protein